MDYNFLFYLFVALVLIILAVALLIVRARTDQFSDAQNESNKNKILEYLRVHGKAQNHELRAFVNCSPRAIVRYCDELEKEKKIKQVGKTGVNAYYELA